MPVNLPEQLDRWVAAHLIDRTTTDRILQFARDSGKEGLRWPALLAIGFGALRLCAGILLFVTAPWDRLSPGRIWRDKARPPSTPNRRIYRQCP